MAQPRAHTVKPVAFLGVLQGMLVMGGFVLVGWALMQDLHDGVMLGCVLFLAYRVGFVRFFLCAEHRRGIVATKAGDFETALAAFRASERTWAGRPALDRYRALLLGSSGPWGFHTLARFNQAFCLTQLGRGDEALALLDTLLREDADNTMANSLKAVIESGRRA